MKAKRLQFGSWWSGSSSRAWSAESRGFQPRVGARAAIVMALALAVSLVLTLALAAPALAGQIVDRVVTNVNGHVVLQSDWEEEIAFEAFANGRDPDSFTAEERKAVLDRLIDQELLREQVRPSQGAPRDQVAARVAEVRKLHPDCATEDRWHATLQRYGLTQGDLEKRLSDQIQLMKLVEDRLRPSIQIDQTAVESYYQDQLLPEMKRAGTSVEPLTQVFGRIKDLLAEKKMNELLSGWLASLRAGSHILAPDPSAGEQNR
ncbi:MAG: SurA N-terminal domain-containing protein [Terriglobales bacterium]|jgi:SurA-like protein